MINLSVFPQTSGAQSEETEANEVVVFLKNGSQLSGVIETWDYGSELILIIGENKELIIPHSEVEKVVEKNLVKLQNSGDKPYNFTEIGWYHHLKMNIIGWNPENRAEHVPGIGGSFSAGYRFNRFQSIGLGLGYDRFIFNTAERVSTIFAEYSGYLLANHFTPFYCLSAGYGLAFKDEDYDLIDANGGWMLHPSVGVRMGQRNIKWTLDVGFKFQKARWVYESFNVTSDQKIIYQRLTIRLGLLI